MKKPIFLILLFIPVILFSKPLFASDQEIADQIQGLRDDLKRERDREQFNKDLDQWLANEKAKIKLQEQQEEAEEAKKERGMELQDEKDLKDQTDAYIAKYKKRCEDREINWGKTPKEAEDACRDEVQSARNLMEAPVSS